jgi:hypothetical protein
LFSLARKHVVFVGGGEGGISMRILLLAIMTITLVATGWIVQAQQIQTDPTNTYAWTENAGWTHAGSTNYGVTVHYYEGTQGWLSGYLWGENIGWLSMGSSGGGPYANTSSNTWGVNIATNGMLSGYAWGENVGWINFGHTNCDAVINLINGDFSGHAWSENIGWIKFKGDSPTYGVRSLAFDTQEYGTPNWWLAYYGVTESYDAGDLVPAWQKYVMDIAPNVTNNGLRITGISKTPTQTEVTFTPVSARRYYTLAWKEQLTSENWSNVVGQSGLMFSSTEDQSMMDTNTMSRAFYRIKVSVTP